jgi:hypothetical protein
VDWVTNSSTLYLDTTGDPTLPAETYYDLLVSDLLGPSGPALTGSTTIHSLTLTSGEAGSLFTVGNYVLNVNGDVTVDPTLGGGASSELVVGSGTINISGDWTIASANASFTAGTGTVNFIGADHAIEGSNTFYRLGLFDSEGSDSSGAIITFQAGATTTVSNLLTITGNDDFDRVILRSSSPGSYWGLTANGTFAIDWAEVTDSDASLGTTISHTNTTNGGHNLNWGFGPLVSCSTSITETDLGALDSFAVKVSSAPATTTVSCTSPSGCSLMVTGTGSTLLPGLYKATAPTHLIPSVDATLSAGTEGYGIQAATSTAGSGQALSLAAGYNVSGDTVGALATTSTTLVSATGGFTNREVVVNHKAAVAILTPVGTYADTITYSCVAN